jgi:F420-dependent oxidoreductase-like protein
MARFGIQIEPQFGFTFREVADLAKEAERLGFTALWASDHLVWDAQSERRNCFDVWALMPALAAVTTKLRLGTLVSCNAYRLPQVLAKTAACVDQISDGRLEFGLGAGWKEMEYKAYGIPFPPVPTRLAQLEEATRLIKQLWTEEKTSFDGKYYRLENAVCAPKPVQRPLKMWLGGAGEKKLLRIVAEHADGWNMVFGQRLPAVKQKLDALKRHCDDVKRDYTKIEKSRNATARGADGGRAGHRPDPQHGPGIRDGRNGGAGGGDLAQLPGSGIRLLHRHVPLPARRRDAATIRRNGRAAVALTQVP